MTGDMIALEAFARAPLRTLDELERLVRERPGLHVRYSEGPASEPLLADAVPIARLADELLAEADDRYRSEFDAGRGPED